MDIAKIVAEEDFTNLKNKEHFEMAHDLAKNLFSQVVKFAQEDLMNLGQISDYHAMSILSTVLSDFMARGIVLLKDVADQGESGYTTQDFQDTIINTVCAILKTNRRDQVVSNSEIKKISISEGK